MESLQSNIGQRDGKRPMAIFLKSQRNYWAGLPRPNPPRNSMGADPGPAAPALSSPPGAFLYAARSPSGLSAPGLGAAVRAGRASPRGRARLRVDGTISEGRWR